MQNNSRLLASSPDPPEIWGPHYWYVIHTFAAAYSENPSDLDKEIAVNFIKNLPFILPCHECRNHSFMYMKLHIKQLDKITSSRQNIVHFFRNFHDWVNERLGKKKYYTISE